MSIIVLKDLESCAVLDSKALATTMGGKGKSKKKSKSKAGPVEGSVTGGGSFLAPIESEPVFGEDGDYSKWAASYLLENGESAVIPLI